MEWLATLVAAKYYLTGILDSHDNTTQKIIKGNSLAIWGTFIANKWVFTDSGCHIFPSWHKVNTWTNADLLLLASIVTFWIFAIFCVPVQY